MCSLYRALAATLASDGPSCPIFLLIADYLPGPIPPLDRPASLSSKGTRGRLMHILARRGSFGLAETNGRSRNVDDPPHRDCSGGYRPRSACFDNAGVCDRLPHEQRSHSLLRAWHRRWQPGRQAISVLPAAGIVFVWLLIEIMNFLRL